MSMCSSLEELPLSPHVDTRFQHRVVLLLVNHPSAGPGNRSIKRIESMAPDLCPDEEEGDAETAGAESPEQASNWGGYESSYALVSPYEILGS